MSVGINKNDRLILDSPSGWNMLPLKYSIAFRRDNLSESTNPDYVFRYIDISAVEYGIGITSYSEISFSEAPSRARKQVRKGDVILSTVRTYLKAIAPITEDNLIVSTGFAVIVPNTYDPLFLLYLLQSDAICEEINRRAWGIAYPAVTETAIGEIKAPYPPLDEQKKIALFLEEKTTIIERLISILDEQLNALEQYKKSLIFETVTKGLDPDVPMKDSGVEWIGEIPIHWECRRLKYLAQSRNSLFCDGDWIESDVIEPAGIRYLTTGNIGVGEYKEQGWGHISQETFDMLHCLRVYPGDILISRLNLPIGRCCLAPDYADEYVVAVDVCVFRPDPIYSKRYLVYAMNTDGFAASGERAARGSTMQRVSRSMLGNMVVPVPPLDEQERIADLLDEKCATIDGVLAAKREQLETLRKYRQSIIYEYVTGKKRVGQE